jgi:hypothetical protein
MVHNVPSAQGIETITGGRVFGMSNAVVTQPRR